MTFRSQNELAEDDEDGTLEVSYLQLGKKVKQDEEWDNPFQPEGEVSEEANIILSLWKEGKQVNEENIRRLKEPEKYESVTSEVMACPNPTECSTASKCMNPNCDS